MSGEQAWLNVCPHDFPSQNSSNWLPLMPGQTLATEGIYADPKIFVLGAGYSRHIMKLCQVFDLSHGDNLLKSFKPDAFDAWCWPNVGSLIRTATHSWKEIGSKASARAEFCRYKEPGGSVMGRLLPLRTLDELLLRDNEQQRKGRKHRHFCTCEIL